MKNLLFHWNQNPGTIEESRRITGSEKSALRNAKFLKDLKHLLRPRKSFQVDPNLHNCHRVKALPNSAEVFFRHIRRVDASFPPRTNVARLMTPFHATASVPDFRKRPATGSLRIAHVVDSLAPGGMENGIANLARTMEPDGCETHVVCLTRRGAFAERMPDPAQVTALEKPPGFLPKWVSVLRRELRRIAPDLIHTHNLGPLIYTGLASLLPGLPPIVHGEHAELGPGETTPKRLWLRRFLYRRCAAIHSVSAALNRNLEANGLRFPKPVAIANGVDTHRFQPSPQRSLTRASLGIPGPESGFVLGVVGRFGPFKRQRLLVEAFDLLAENHPSLWLVLVGDGGPEADSVRERVAASPHSGRIRLAGFQAEPAPWYQAFDLLVQPSVNEGMSNALLEAMACGTPILAQVSCGCAELIRHGENGFLTECRTSRDLADAIHPFVTDPSGDWRQVGPAAREIVTRNFSLDSMARAYRELYEAAAGKGRE